MPDEDARGESERDVSERIVTGIAKGDRSAEREMYERYARAIVFALKRRGASPEEAEDLCHETFVTACLKLRGEPDDSDGSQAEGIRDSQSLAAYLQGIAIFKFLGQRRTERRRDTWANSDLISEAASGLDNPFEGVVADQLHRLLQQALDSLPVERDRDILISVYLRDEDRASIRQRLEIDSEHFNRVLYRARQRLCECLRELQEAAGATVTILRDFASGRH